LVIASGKICAPGYPCLRPAVPAAKGLADFPPSHFITDTKTACKKQAVYDHNTVRIPKVKGDRLIMSIG
jgi:hypothetical protein